MVREVRVGDAIFGGGRPLVLIAGPCVIESEEGCLQIAERLVQAQATAFVSGAKVLSAELTFRGSTADNQSSLSTTD